MLNMLRIFPQHNSLLELVLHKHVITGFKTFLTVKLYSNSSHLSVLGICSWQVRCHSLAQIFKIILKHTSLSFCALMPLMCDLPPHQNCRFDSSRWCCSMGPLLSLLEIDVYAVSEAGSASSFNGRVPNMPILLGIFFWDTKRSA